MAFDPTKLAAISDQDRAQLTRELGETTKADALARITDLAKRTAEGDNKALTELTASAAASLAVSLLNHIAALSGSDPNGTEHRAMMAALPGCNDVVILAAMQAAMAAFCQMGYRPPGMLDRQLALSHAVSKGIWTEVYNAFAAAKQNPSVGQRQSAIGSDIYMVPRSKPD